MNDCRTHVALINLVYMALMCSIRLNHNEMRNCSSSQAAKKRKLSAGSIHIPAPVPLPQVRSEGWFPFVVRLNRICLTYVCI